MKLATIIMAHPSRTDAVARLADALDTKPAVVYDEHNHIWATARAALLSAPSDATHLMLLQDDTIVSQRLAATVRRIIKVSGNTPVSLYMGDQRPNPARYRPWILAADDTGSTMIRGGGPVWGVGCVYPVSHLEGIVEYGDRYTNVGQSYDGRVTAYYRSIQTLWLFAWPSLVDHDTSIPSLHSSTPRRRAFNFIGADQTGYDTDWSKILNTDPSSLHPPVMFVHRSTGRKRRVGKFSRDWDRLSRQGSWDIVS